MVRKIRYINRPLRSGLFQIFCSNPFLALCTFAIIIGISSVIPLAFIWLIQCLFLDFSFLKIESTSLRTILTLWSVVEVIFFVYQCYLYLKIQQRTSPPSITSKQRDQLVSYALGNVENVSDTLCKWFLDCSFEDIDRDSIVGWLAFAFYSKPIDELNTEEYQEIDLFIDKVETEHQLKASTEKSKKNISCMKHTLDPVRVIFRPLVYYFLTDTILNGILTNSLLYLRGYRFVQIGHLQFWTHYDQTENTGVEEEEEPIIFFHGLGLGLLTYQPLISRIHQKFSRNRRIILISMRCISMRYPSLKDIPNILETTDSIKQIFEYYQMSTAIFIGHSYGTACLAWMVKKCPEYISRLIFIDPVCFLLFEPFVVYNFRYRTPYKLGHLYMYYFVSREMGISHVISRHFWWTQNNLYIEQLRSCSSRKIPTYALLAGRDCIVNTHLVRDYLTNYDIEYYWAPNISHGSYMHDKHSWEKISQWIS